MTIFFDTNILRKHIFNQEPIKELFELSKEGKIKIYISEMVLWEYEKHFIININDKIRKYNEILIDLLKLIPNENKELDYDKIAITKIFNEEKDKLIKDYKIEIAKFYHESIIDSMKNRYLESKAPFHNEGDNFKDYIIWESYREIINKNKDEEYIFMSNNLKDFSNNIKYKQSGNTNKKDCRGEYFIHKDFLEDIKNANLNSYADIDSFTKNNKNYKNIYKKYLFKKFEQDKNNIHILKKLFEFHRNENLDSKNNLDYEIEIFDNSNIVDKGGNFIEVDVNVIPADTSLNKEKNEAKTKCTFTVDTQNLKFDFDPDSLIGLIKN